MNCYLAEREFRQFLRVDFSGESGSHVPRQSDLHVSVRNKKRSRKLVKESAAREPRSWGITVTVDEFDIFAYCEPELCVSSAQDVVCVRRGEDQLNYD